MARPARETVIGPLHRLLGRADVSAPSDALLLEDFVARQDEKAFEILVWRHAAMVLGVCGRVLRDSHVAEDAFQATFLVFARRADTIGRRESVGGWLYKVAYRVALRAKGRARRDARVEPLRDMPEREPTDHLVWNDLRPVLDAEIARLPEKYRVPFVLCYLEGLTNEQAAEQIGCPKGTVLSRLARGREWLRARLVRRGVSLSAASLVTILSTNAVSALAPGALIGGTVRAGIPFAGGAAACGLVPASVAALTNGVLHTMLALKMKLPVAILALVALGVGAAVFGRPEAPTVRPMVGVAPTTVAVRTPAEMLVPAVAPPASDPAGDRENAKRPDLEGYVIVVGKDGKTLTIDVVRERGGKPVKTEVALGPKTVVTYDQVATKGAKPTEGYAARVWVDGAGKGPAARIDFWGPEAANRGLGLPGVVTGVDGDGKGFTLRYAERGAGQKYRFNDKTVLVFSSVAAGGAKIAEKMEAIVFTDENVRGGDRIAGYVLLFGGAQGRFDREPDITGKLLAADDKTLTIEVPALPGGESKKVVLKLGAKCSINYHDVGTGGAKPVEGQAVKAWLETGSKDTVTDVALTGAAPNRWVTIDGKVVGVSEDGATVVVEYAPAVADEKPKKTTIKFTAETRIVYSLVGPDEAKPTIGYGAQVRLLDGSKDTASHVLFTGRHEQRGR